MGLLVYYRNPDTRKQWLDPDDPGQPANPVVKQKSFESKVMLCVWWNFQGVIHFELVPEGRAINAELYSQQLERMYGALGERYPALLHRNRKRVLLQQDNARPHTAHLTQEKIEELEGIELLPHTPYPIQLTVRTLRHRTITFSGRWLTSYADGSSGMMTK